VKNPTYYASGVVFLRSLEGQGMFDRTDIEWLRNVAFIHKCRDDSPSKMLAALLPIFTVLAVKERLTA